MASISTSTQRALSHFVPSKEITSITPLGNAGGFSGAQLWRLTVSGNEWCLRRWPQEHPSEKQLDWIHRVLFHAAKNGNDFLPLPCRLKNTKTHCRVDEAFWELSPWMAGKADFWEAPSDNRLAAALRALAEFHRATNQFAPQEVAAAPGIIAREKQLQQWQLLRQNPNLASQLKSDSRFASQAFEMLTLMPAVIPRCEQWLSKAPKLSKLQPCLRDIWHDHVLFNGSKVSAFVDFGAMRIDSVAVDLARLLGSLVGDAADRWQFGIQAYQEVHPIAAEDQAKLASIDLANSILSGANWIRWIYVERRRFENGQAVQARLEQILERLRFQAKSRFGI